MLEVLTAVAPWLLLAAFWFFMIWSMKRREKRYAVVADGELTLMNGEKVPWSLVKHGVETRTEFKLDLLSNDRIHVRKESGESAEVTRSRLQSHLGSKLKP